MELNVNTAFSFAFKDENWLKKLGVGFIIATVCILASGFLIPIFLHAALFNGWMLQLIERVRKGEPHPLPTWDNLGDLLRLGINPTLALFIYQLPALAVGILTVVVLLLMSIVSLIPFIGFVIAAFMIIVLGLLYVVVLAFSIGGYVFYLAGLTRYIETDEFNAFFDLQATMALFKQPDKPTRDLALYLVLVTVLTIFASSSGVVASLVSVMSTAVIGHLIGQYMRIQDVEVDRPLPKMLPEVL